MELVKKNIHMNKLKCKTNLQLTLDDDFNVPDVKPDVDKIVKEQGEIVLSEVKAMNGKLMVKGDLSFNLLYVSSDSSRPVHNIIGKLPFEEMVNMDEACPDNNIVVKWEIEDLSTTLINSRKISVRSIVSFSFIAEDVYDQETAVGVECDEECESLSKKIVITQLGVNKKDTYRIKDEVILPSGKSNIFEILYNEVALRNLETRILENKINIKGDLILFILYFGEDEEQPMQYMETEVPFGGTIDCNGCSDDMISDIGISIMSKDIEIKPDADGEERIIDMEVVLELDVKAYEEEELEILSDVYSTSKQLIPNYEEAYYENLVLKNNGKARIVDRINIGKDQPSILQICNASGSIKIDEQQLVENGIQIDGIVEVQLLYITDNDQTPIGATKGVIPFNQVLEVKNISDSCIYDIRPSIEQLSVMMLDGMEVEIKAGINLDTIIFDKIKENIITDLKVEDLDTEKLQNMPSMIGYVVKSEDTLWKIAKEFYTTVDSIKELNELEQREVHTGDRLLLLKKVDLVL